MTVTSNHLGTVDNQAVTQFTITNHAGMGVDIINYGATVQSIRVPDAKGNIDDVVLGFDTLEEYVNGNAPYLGVVCGRVANRICDGRFTLEGVDYTLAVNNGTNALHGGLKGFDKRVWSTETTDNGVRMTLISADGEEGYPGQLTVSILYTLSEDNTLTLDYQAVTDKPTIINLTNHSYFNLAGHDSGLVLDHEIRINASAITPPNENLIPTGEITPVAGTPFDFMEPHKIGERIDTVGGYDHNFVLNPDAAEPSVRVFEPTSGRTMEMKTTEPGVQFYTGNFLADTQGKRGATYPKQGGFCLEAQHYPDSINHSHFPTTVLKPGETYTQRTSYQFGIA